MEEDAEGSRTGLRDDGGKHEGNVDLHVRPCPAALPDRLDDRSEVVVHEHDCRRRLPVQEQLHKNLATGA